MDCSKKVNKRQISFIIHDLQPEFFIEGISCFGNIDGVCKSCKRFHDNGKGTANSNSENDPVFNETGK